MFSSELFKSLEIADKLDDVPKVRADHYEALTGEDAHSEDLAGKNDHSNALTGEDYVYKALRIDDDCYEAPTDQKSEFAEEKKDL